MSASQRHPEVLSNLQSAVSGYWRNGQFTEGEGYANVTVSDNLNTSSDIKSFMDYLCTPGDDLISATSIGSWSINQPREVKQPLNENPKSQPPASKPASPKLTSEKVSNEGRSVTPRPLGLKRRTPFTSAFQRLTAARAERARQERASEIANQQTPIEQPTIKRSTITTTGNPNSLTTLGENLSTSNRRNFFSLSSRVRRRIL